MADTIEQRDFFISFNGADLAYAEAIDAALKKGGFTTYFHHVDLRPGGNIPKWMDDALMNSGQMLALYSPEYVGDEAVYAEAERYARFWQDSRGAKFKIVPVVLRDVKFTPLMGVYKRISTKGMTPLQTAAAVVAALKKPDEVQQREVLHRTEPLPKIFNVIYRHNPNFTGRFEAMESLQKSLREGNVAVTAVAGMGGVGKTTLAAEYCHRFGGGYGGVWWVRSEQELVMLSDLATLGQRLGLIATGNIEADARAALENIASRTEPWLMVYDNAPHADAVAKWLPVGSVRCLITSRFAVFDGVTMVVRLDQWSAEVTADYLLARTGRNDKEGALHLAHSLGGLPLAAEQAAVFLKSRRGITFDDYGYELARLIGEDRAAGAKGEYPDTVYAAFVKSLETFESTETGKTALDMLRLCSFLSPDGVDLRLLIVDPEGSILPPAFAATMADKFKCEDVLAPLKLASLLRREDGPFGPILIFHRLLLEVVRDWMGANDRNLWGTAAATLVDVAFPDRIRTDPSMWPLCGRLLPHVASLEAHASHIGEAGSSVAGILNHAAMYLLVRGDNEGARLLAEKAVTVGRSTAVDAPLTLANYLNNLAVALVRLGEFEEAESAYREVLEIKEPRLEKNDPNFAITLSHLAQLYLRRQDAEKAKPLFLRVVEIMLENFGIESAEYGHAISDLGACYGHLAKEKGDAENRAKQEQYTTLALEIVRKLQGTRHPETAVTLQNFAVLKAAQSDWLNAAKAAEHGVAIMLSLDLMEHAAMPGLIADLAYLWEKSGQSDKTARLRRGDLSDLMPAVAQVEAEHHAWVAKDAKHRHFGPPSPFVKN